MMKMKSERVSGTRDDTSSKTLINLSDTSVILCEVFKNDGKDTNAKSAHQQQYSIDMDIKIFLPISHGPKPNHSSHKAEQPPKHDVTCTWKKHDINKEKSLCDYTKGRWVRDEMGPLYNGSSCGTIKDGQNCLRHDMADQILVIFIGNGNRTNAIYRDSTLTGFLIL
ncbi:hypothetical protein YC2023_016498 [Brassica napus]